MLQHPSVRPWERSIVWAMTSAIRSIWSGAWDNNATAIVEQYAAFIRLIHALDLDQAIDAAPILDASRIPLDALTTGERDSKSASYKTVSYSLADTCRSK